MGEPIRAEVELTEDAFVEAYLGYAKKMNLVRGLQRMMALVLVVIAMFVVVSWPVTPGVWTGLALGMLAGLFLVQYQWTWVARRAFRHLPEARRRYEVTFTEDGVREKGPRAEVSYAWSTLVGWLETEHLIVALSAGGVNGFWDKRSFAAEQLTSLRALLGERIVPPKAADPGETPKARSNQAWKTILLWLLLIAVFIGLYTVLGGEPQ